MNQIHFIVGMSRAGSTWLVKCLNEHPDTVAFGESAFWGRHYIPPSSDGRYDTEQLGLVMHRLELCAYATLPRNEGVPDPAVLSESLERRILS